MLLPDESVCKRPEVSITTARNQLENLYGIEAELAALNGERDRNFLVSPIGSDQNERLVFKVANTLEDPAMLRCQERVFERLSACENIESIRVIPSVSGQTIEPIDGDDGAVYHCRLTTYLEGTLLSAVRPRSTALLESLGSTVARADLCLEGFKDDALERPLLWTMQNAEEILVGFAPLISDQTKRVLIDYFLEQFRRQLRSVEKQLRWGVIHNDANDNNVVVQNNGPWNQCVSGLIDFGDMVESWVVADPAIACAYAMLDQPQPLDVAASIVKGYHQINPLNEAEIASLYSLIGMRLCLSVCICAHQKTLEPDNEYLSISEQPAWRLLEQLHAIPASYAHYIFRDACGMDPVPDSSRLRQWLMSRESFSSLVDVDLHADPLLVLDTSVSSPHLNIGIGSHEPQRMTRDLFRAIEDTGAVAGIGRYDEYRLIYGGESFSDFSGHLRTLHVGIDLFQPAGSPVYAPLKGKVWSLSNNTRPLDYGGCLILVHEVIDPQGNDFCFYTLYGHLDFNSLESMSPGDEVTAGQQLGRMGDLDQNGYWPPHVHFEIILDLLDQTDTFYGVGNHAHRNVWLALCPDPNMILRIPEQVVAQPCLYKQRDSRPLLDARSKHLSAALSLSYREPITLGRGVGQYLFDSYGRRYLDAVNNVPHVGHCHPHVVRAGQHAASVLNTNTRYLYPEITNYAERLLATFPDPLSVVFLVNSGSEANDLGLRLAWTHTGRKDIVVLDHAYHGNLTALIDLSAYKHDGPGGLGNPPWVHKLSMPDGLRGQYRTSDPQYAHKYAGQVNKAITDAEPTGGIAAFMCESVLGCGGQVFLPDGYLNEIYRQVRSNGGVCIADEVQTGFGRVGSYFWAFELQQVVPDIVTLGKPAGNGHPIGAVVTTQEVARSFVTGMEYFNTFGGNPVSCAIGSAVLDVIEHENLQSHASETGRYLKQQLNKLQGDYPIIAEVRGEGFFIGIELTTDQESLTPAPNQATYIAERMKQLGILMSTDGPCHNVLKIKPPMVFSRENAGQLVDALATVLAEHWARPEAY
jgi:4-aminobutyrate aminotransferase-like enzyme/Ser/Thr protein kinase RdoA (MazF antagonist)